MNKEERASLVEEITRLRRERRAVILAHGYQRAEVQDVADFVGDSLELSRRAAETDAAVIVFAGVRFMAESAAVLSPDKLVLLPEAEAGCPMADMITVEDVRRLRAQHPKAAVVAYVNTSAAVKAESDICCTSANAVAVTNSLPHDEIIFIPDQNLAAYVAARSDKRIIPWPGFCNTHHRVRLDDVLRARTEHPGALLVVHPECRPEVVESADRVASTTGMVRLSREENVREFVIGTEMGLLHRLKKESPNKTFHILKNELVCPNMKRTHLVSVRDALRDLRHRIEVPPDIARRARRALDRMLEVQPPLDKARTEA